MRKLSAVPSRRGEDRRGWLRGAPPPRWVRVLPPALVVAVCAATLISPDPLDIGFLLGAIPPLAVLSYSPLATALLGAVVVALLNIPALRLDRPGGTDLLTVVFVAVLSVFVSFVRSRRDAQLDLERTVAEAAQHAVVPPLPERVGPVRCAGLYRAAQHGTLVGGDFFDVRAGPFGVRAVMGDVQGHGLSAVATVASLLGAFREAVLDQPRLSSVAGRLDRRLLVDSAQARHPELFATAVLLEFTADARQVRIVVCGSPPPVLLRGATATELCVTPWTPLGLGLEQADAIEVCTVSLDPGDRLFLASDGVVEARDDGGAFYPLADRLAALADEDPTALAERVWADLVRFCPDVQDDVTMLVLTPAPAAVR
ncbi:serine/threonine-protein phosphatase [Streptomyces sp. TRM S81-3]|uniref:Serine/threonine-protein phosphatase n=1 Tax=Streptomyces griseicoloratus TaxID=2752516 RepID=A0A926L8H6_9ACTN|nr:PP2C family protein-serine/threonine phosphatase [Streptomyces griseicoloratus]MBD0423344.1 serine/threonine-protein phosphatase [Streptomyces griseicoloratus]